MPTHDNPARASSAGDEFALPEHWPPAVRDLFEEVLNESPDLSGAALGTLYEACHLMTAAEALDDVARAAGYVSTGAAGHVVTHPATVEARLARTAAAAILHRLRPDSALKRETKARRAARARHGTGGGRR